MGLEVKQSMYVPHDSVTVILSELYTYKNYATLSSDKQNETKILFFCHFGGRQSHFGSLS
jgi:hypothetical protein